MFKTILAACAAAAVAFGAAAASATPLTFNFTIDFNAAPDATGSFTIDSTGLTGSGLEIFAPNNTTTTLLSFTAMVGGLTYTETIDSSFDEFPQVSFLDGAVSNISYAGQIGNQCLSIGSGSSFGVFFGDVSIAQRPCSEPGFTSGQITNIVAEGSTPLPVPATAALFGLGLVGLGLATRRRRTVQGIRK